MRHRAAALALLVGYLGIQGSHLALWYHGQPEPAQVYPYRAETFSPEDQQKLRDGIPFRSSTELQALLEDYLS